MHLPLKLEPRLMGYLGLVALYTLDYNCSLTYRAN